MRIKTSLFRLYAFYRIGVRYMPVLESDRNESNDGYDHKSQQEYPPKHRCTISEVFQPTIHTIESNRSSQHKTSSKNDQVASVKHDQYLRSRRSQYFTDSHLFPTVLTLEYNQTEYTNNGDKDGNNTEQGDQVTDLQFPFLGLLQDLVIKGYFERINRIYLG